MSQNLPGTVRRLGRSVRGHPGRGAAALVLVVLIVGALAVVQSRLGDEPGTADQGTGSGATAAGGASATGSIGGTGSGPGGAVPGTASGGSGRQPGAGPVRPSDGAAPGDESRPGVSPGRTSGGGQDPVTLRPPVRCSSTGTPRAAPLPSPDERDGRRWVTVGRLAGSCDASSSPFRLQGIDTRLVWRSDADSFSVFVVDVTVGREATAGFADAECAGSCSESQRIVPAAGSYTLEVQAGDAPWEVEVQEYRSP